MSAQILAVAPFAFVLGLFANYMIKPRGGYTRMQILPSFACVFFIALIVTAMVKLDQRNLVGFLVVAFSVFLGGEFAKKYNPLSPPKNMPKVVAD